MSNLGVGVIINMLGGNAASAAAYEAALGKTIQKSEVKDDGLNLHFTDGTGIRFVDDGQSCCEARYMRTDDDLPYFDGAVFQKADVVDVPNAPAEYEEHEIQMLVITTSKGVITISNHNEHNGYYGGFYLIIRPL